MLLPRQEWWRPRKHGKWLVNAKANALIDTMADNLADAKLDTLGDTPEDVEAAALV